MRQGNFLWHTCIQRCTSSLSTSFYCTFWFVKFEHTNPKIKFNFWPLVRLSHGLKSDVFLLSLPKLHVLLQSFSKATPNSVSEDGARNRQPQDDFDKTYNHKYLLATVNKLNHLCNVKFELNHLFSVEFKLKHLCNVKFKLNHLCSVVVPLSRSRMATYSFMLHFTSSISFNRNSLFFNFSLLANKIDNCCSRV